MYTHEQIKELDSDGVLVSCRTNDLLERYIILSPNLKAEAQEHCNHGICRRLNIIGECIAYFFGEIPPAINKELSIEERSRSSIYLHAFLINICGIIDNMAWLWAFHSNLDKKLDLEKKKRMVGLFNKDFSDYLPESLLKQVAEYTDWYNFTVHHRHPTAHRIPPYIIPYTISESDSSKRRDYTPRYIHSLSSKYGTVYLHPQSLADTKTVLELLETLYKEVNIGLTKQIQPTPKSSVADL